MGTTPERRRASRVATSLSARLIASDGSCSVLEVDDVSVVGLHGRCGAAVGTGQGCRIELSTAGGSVEARGTIVRRQGTDVAVRFEHLPFESYERLRAFLLANASDPAVIADELSDRLSFLEESA